MAAPWSSIFSAIGATAGAVGTVVGRDASASDRDMARREMMASLADLQSVGEPPDLSKKIILERLESQGKLTPEAEEDLNIAFNDFNKITEDSTLRDAQTGALAELQQRGRVGLSPEDKAALNEIRQQNALDAEAKRQQILQSFAQRGMGGSGNELASQLIASQNQANRQSDQSMQQSALASQRALQALGQQAGLAGSIRGQDLALPTLQANANLDIEKFNTANSRQVQQRNVQNRNVAQATNLSESQRIADYNTTQENRERQRQAEAQRQFWLDKVNKAKMISDSRLGLSKYYQGQADETQAGYSSVGAGFGGAASSAGAGMGQGSKNMSGGSSGGGMTSGESSSMGDYGSGSMGGMA